MRVLSINATDREIKDLVVEWIELLAQEKYEDALSLFSGDVVKSNWTPEKLKMCINKYGVIELDLPTLNGMLEEYGVEEFKVTSLFTRDDADKIINDSIDVDRESLYGLNPDEYVGMIHFKDIPLSGYLSDLTARFYIKRVDSSYIALEFFGIHVM